MMKLFNMRLLGVALCALSLTSCVVEYTPSPYLYGRSYGHGYGYSSYGYRPHYGSVVRPCITPVAHGFDPDPQYVRGWVFRGGDGMPYAAEF